MRMHMSIGYLEPLVIVKYQGLAVELNLGLPFTNPGSVVGRM